MHTLYQNQSNINLVSKLIFPNSSLLVYCIISFIKKISPNPTNEKVNKGDSSAKEITTVFRASGEKGH